MTELAARPAIKCGAASASAIGDQTGLPDRTERAAILRAASDTRSLDTIR